MDIDIIHPAIERYLDELLAEREPWFIKMEKMAEEEDFPAVGPQVGMLLEILARSINARRIMELGSGFGYSGLWFARALPPDGYLLLTDFEEKNQRLAEANFREAGKSGIMEFRVGDALQLLKEEKGPYDIIFNDVDKEFYPQVIEPVYRLLRKGGLFITDNTLWYGRVTQPNPDETTTLIQEFNRHLMGHKGFLTTQLPLRDGISVSIRITDDDYDD
jgi:predicted O-methyltransferase YrrM